MKNQGQDSVSNSLAHDCAPAVPEGNNAGSNARGNALDVGVLARRLAALTPGEGRALLGMLQKDGGQQGQRR